MLIRLIIQNGGTLSRTKRAQFAELSDPELAAIETAVQAATASGLGTETPDPGS